MIPPIAPGQSDLNQDMVGWVRENPPYFINKHVYLININYQ